MSKPGLISEETFGTTSNGQTLKQFTLRNSQGAVATFVDLGAALTGFRLSEAEDSPNLILDCDTAEFFFSQPSSLGATVGRFANRIGYGKLTIDGKAYELEVNSSPHHLHGGSQGYSKKIWESHISLEDTTPTLIFNLISPDGDMGYPGELKIEQRIQLMDDNRLCIHYQAQTSKTTPINLTNHAYFNLGGATAGSLADHEFRIHADHYTQADETVLPSGQILPVANSVMDLRHWQDVSQRIADLDSPVLKLTGGYDHNYVFANELSDTMRLQAEARHKKTGYWMSCSSNLPGMQFYTGNFLAGTAKNAEFCYPRNGAFCMEPGYWPDSPNHDHFPNCMLKPGQTWRASIIYQFGKNPI